MPELDLSFLQRTDPRMEVHPEIRAALMASERSDRFELGAALSRAFADPSAFLRDKPVQKAFLELIGPDRARQLMRAYRLFGAAREASLSTMIDGGENSLYTILSSSHPGVDINPQNLPSIIRRLRTIAYERREAGLPGNILRSVQVDFVQGYVEMKGGVYGEELELDHTVLFSTPSFHQDESLNVRAMFAPDIGVRVLGERELAFVANEQLHLLWREGMRRGMGKSKREPMRDDWSYRHSINELIRIFGDADATPFVESILDQLIEEDKISESRRHLVIATYHDCLMSHLDRKLQMLGSIVPDRSSEGTIDGLIHSLRLAMDSSAMPVELRDDDNVELADTFSSSRERLKDLLGEEESLHFIRKVIGEYLRLYDDKGLVWFLGQTLPLVAFFSDAESLHQNGTKVVQAFRPNAHYGWNSYAIVMEQVRSIIDPGWSDPDGGERMTVVGADMPLPADSFGYEMFPGPRTVNHAASCMRGGMLMAG